MDNKRFIKKLSNLAQLDIDAVNAYETALKKIDDTDLHRKVDLFRQDHLRHVDDLNNLIVKLGGKPVEFSKDLKGYLIDGMTALRSVTGTKGAINAMETNEIITNKSYSESLKDDLDLTDEMRTLLEKNYSDEQRHLAFIRETLKSFDRK